MRASPRIAVEVRDAGAHGYVSKSQASRDFVLAIQTFLSGGTFFAAPSGQPTDPMDIPTTA
jgi:DNA-binding NarL/FixJ family response regulator